MFKRAMIGMMLLIGQTEPALAQQDSKVPVTYTVETPSMVNPEDHFTVTVVFDIEPGWYVYAPVEINTMQGKIPTRVSFQTPKGIKTVDGLIVPEDNGFVDTYRGSNVRMSQNLQVEKGVPPGVYTIKANIVYQTCNGHICYPPVEEIKYITITIKP